MSNPYRTAEPAMPAKTDTEREAELVEELRIATEHLAHEKEYGEHCNPSSMMLRVLSVIMIQGLLAAHQQKRLERKINRLLMAAGRATDQE